MVSIKVTEVANVQICSYISYVSFFMSCFAAYVLEMVLLYWCGGFVLYTFEYVYIVQ